MGCFVAGSLSGVVWSAAPNGKSNPYFLTVSLHGSSMRLKNKKVCLRLLQQFATIAQA